MINKKHYAIDFIFSLMVTSFASYIVPRYIFSIINNKNNFLNKIFFYDLSRGNLGTLLPSKLHYMVKSFSRTLAVPLGIDLVTAGKTKEGEVGDIMAGAFVRSVFLSELSEEARGLAHHLE